MSTKKEQVTTEVNELRPLRSVTLAGDHTPSGDGHTPARILLAPWGHVESTNGSFVVDEESASSALAAFEEHGTDLPIDYEHQTLGGNYSSPTGQAPAAGWIKRIFAEPGIGLMAEIVWTDRAKEMLAAKEYRYLSPVAVIRKTDRKLMAIHSAALTNKPAIVGMAPIVNRCESAISDGTPGAPGARQAALAVDAPLAALRDELELPADAGAEEVLLAASERLQAMHRAAQQRHVEQRVSEAMRAGKLVEAQRAWAEAMVAREENLFDEWLHAAPVIVARGATRPPTDDAFSDNGHRSVVARARAEFRNQRLLGTLTSEEAYVADAVRHDGTSKLACQAALAADRRCA